MTVIVNDDPLDMAAALATHVWDLIAEHPHGENVTDDESSAIRERAFRFSRDVKSRGANDVAEVRRARQLSNAALVYVNNPNASSWRRLCKASSDYETARLR
jgi:hypothetical protein